MAQHRIRDRFQAARAANRGSLLPYFTSGFPDSATTEKLVLTADALGVPVVELGEPYSDSIADGPVIQDSFHAALAHGHRLEHTFELVSRIRSSVSCGLAAMVSFSLVHRIGVEEYMHQAAACGLDGVILPDLPVEECATVSKAAKRAGLDYIGLVAPTTSAARREAIARESTGFLYQIASVGTTGERSVLSTAWHDEAQELRRSSGLPVCVGFGIGNAEQVRTACEYADGAIVGSAIVRRINEGLRTPAPPGDLVAAVSEFLSGLITGTIPATGPGER